MQIGGKLEGNRVSLTICRKAGLNFRDTEAFEFWGSEVSSDTGGGEGGGGWGYVVWVSRGMRS